MWTGVGERGAVVCGDLWRPGGKGKLQSWRVAHRRGWKKRRKRQVQGQGLPHPLLHPVSQNQEATEVGRAEEDSTQAQSLAVYAQPVRGRYMNWWRGEWSPVVATAPQRADLGIAA